MSEDFTQRIRVFDSDEEQIVSIDANTNEIILKDDQGSATMHINAKEGDLLVGGFQNPGRVLVRNGVENDAPIQLSTSLFNGSGGRLMLQRENRRFPSAGYRFS